MLLGLLLLSAPRAHRSRRVARARLGDERAARAESARRFRGARRLGDRRVQRALRVARRAQVRDRAAVVRLVVVRREPIWFVLFCIVLGFVRF